jgi:8-oxo-dGTP diphosphatase
MMDFVGSKVALFCGDALLTYLRDNKPGLPWPAMWDLPGGGREGNETAEECVSRETFEEFGLHLTAERLLFRRVLPSMLDPLKQSIFFAGHITPHEITTIRFGDEGRYWQMMPVTEFLIHPRAIPDLQNRVALAMAAL